MLVPIGITLLLVIGGLLTMGFFNRGDQFHVDGSTVIVTGGSQGLGLCVAKQLAAKGANVAIVAQNVSKLEKALEQIKVVSPNRKHTFYSFDLRSESSASAIIRNVTEWNDTPDIVFNCAGNCVPGFFASMSLEDHRLQMDTIYWTCAYMAHATLQTWIKSPKKRRHLIFTSSTLAFYPLAGYAAYNPAKAAMRSLADTLNQEAEVYNGSGLEIKIHIAFPMGIQTPGYESEQKTKPLLTQKLEEDDKPQDPDALAKILISGLESGQYMLTSTIIGHVMKGWAMGASQRTSIADYFWSLIGSIIVLFIVPDFMSKCRKWGKEKGLIQATK